MRRLVLLLVPSLAFAEPRLVYEHPRVAKFEVYGLVGEPSRVDSYNAVVGFDWRAGYPFLVGPFYLKGEGLDGVGGRAKARVSLLWKVKGDFELGSVYEKRKEKGVLFLVGLEQVVFLRGSFSLRLSGRYYFGSEERRWVVSAGFGF